MRVAADLAGELASFQVLPLDGGIHGIAVFVEDLPGDAHHGAFGAGFLGEGDLVDVVETESPRAVGGREIGEIAFDIDFISPIVVGGIDFFAEIDWSAPLGPGILSQAHGFEDIEFPEARMSIRAEIEGFAVGMEKGGAFAEGGVDDGTEIDGGGPGVASAKGHEDIAVARRAPVKLGASGHPFADHAFAIGGKENRHAIGGHKGVGIPVFAIHGGGEVAKVGPAALGLFVVVVIAEAQMSHLLESAIDEDAGSVEGESVDGFVLAGIDFVTQILSRLPGLVLERGDIDIETALTIRSVPAGEEEAFPVRGDGRFDLLELGIDTCAQIPNGEGFRGSPQEGEDAVDPTLHCGEAVPMFDIDPARAFPVLSLHRARGDALQGHEGIL